MIEQYCKVKETPEKTRHAAIIQIDKELILKMLDFEGGTIHRVYEPEEYIDPDYFCLVLEHPDLKPTPINQALPKVTPIYQKYFGNDGTLLSIKRLE